MVCKPNINYLDSSDSVCLYPVPEGWTAPKDNPLEISEYEPCLVTGNSELEDGYEKARRVVVLPDSTDSDQFLEARFLKFDESVPEGYVTPSSAGAMSNLIFSTRKFSIPQPGPQGGTAYLPIGTCQADGSLWVYEKNKILGPDPQQVVTEQNKNGFSLVFSGLDAVTLRRIAQQLPKGTWLVSAGTPTNGYRRDLYLPTATFNSSFLPRVEKLAEWIQLPGGFSERGCYPSELLDFTTWISGWAFSEDPKACELYEPLAIYIRSMSDPMKQLPMQVVSVVFSLLVSLGASYLIAMRTVVAGAKASAEVMTSKDVISKDDALRAVKDKTEELKDPNRANPSLKDEIEPMKRTMSLPMKHHVAISGASGGGKGERADVLGHEAVMGRIRRVPRGVRVWEVTAAEVIRRGKSWENGAAQVWGHILDEAIKKPTVLILTEGSQFMGVKIGKGDEDLFDALLTIMDGKDPKYKELWIIVDSSKTSKILKNKGDVRRRIQLSEVDPPTIDTVQDAINLDLTRKKSDPDWSAILEKVSMSEKAITALAYLGEYESGAPPSCHIKSLNQLLGYWEQAAIESGEGHHQITETEVIEHVARETGHSVEVVRSMMSEKSANKDLANDKLREAYFRYGDPDHEYHPIENKGKIIKNKTRTDYSSALKVKINSAGRSVSDVDSPPTTERGGRLDREVVAEELAKKIPTFAGWSPVAKAELVDQLVEVWTNNADVQQRYLPLGDQAIPRFVSELVGRIPAETLKEYRGTAVRESVLPPRLRERAMEEAVVFGLASRAVGFGDTNGETQSQIIAEALVKAEGERLFVKGDRDSLRSDLEKCLTIVDTMVAERNATKADAVRLRQEEETEIRRKREIPAIFI